MKQELIKLKNLVLRNNTLYFKDKMQFFLSLITPMILIVLFLTFLGNVYKSSLIQCLPEGITLENNIINAFTGSWLFSSILATSCITVAFCSNVSVNDKITKANLDFQITPIRKTTLQVSYTISNFLSTIIVCITAFLISLIYFAIVGWYLSIVDIILILTTIIFTTLMGCLAASIVNLFISTQGALSASCTLISSMYGFLCGAYMPISQFSTGIQNFISFMPGTYSTILFRNYYMRGIIENMSASLPSETINFIKINFDASFKFFGTEVQTWVMYLVLILSIAVLFVIYILLIIFKNKDKNKKIFNRKSTLTNVK